MKIGQEAECSEYLDDKLIGAKTIQLVSINNGERRFKVSGSDDHHMTLGKNVPFDNTWYSGKNKTNKRRTIITPYEK